jgi:hypothetical protein
VPALAVVAIWVATTRRWVIYGLLAVAAVSPVMELSSALGVWRPLAAWEVALRDHPRDIRIPDLFVGEPWARGQLLTATPWFMRQSSACGVLTARVE